jgi:hypothetical protein
MSDEISVKVRFLGDITMAEAFVMDGHTPRQFQTEDSTGAKAVTRLVEQMGKAGLGGRRFRCFGSTDLAGVIPSRSYRRKPMKPRPVQTKWAV